jgi:hypothetical protein
MCKGIWDSSLKAKPIEATAKEVPRYHRDHCSDGELNCPPRLRYLDFDRDDFSSLP